MTTSITKTHAAMATAGPRPWLISAFMCLALVTTWALTHQYIGLSRDAELYAVQALARINPALGTDVFLAATSQDEYTLFSPLYAWTIRWLGLRQAGCAMFTACTLAFLAGAWTIARELWTANMAWLVVAALVVIACPYGAYGVFHYSENYLTARSMAEALVVLSFAARFRRLSIVSWLLASMGMLIHPLMTLPGVFLLLLLPLSWRWCLLSSACGTALAILLAFVAMMSPHTSGPLAIMSGSWLEMVNERSQFLFLQNWHLNDWETHGRILLCLSVGALTAQADRIGAICRAAAAVGVAGLLVGYIASSWGPVAILLQGQAWRWFWIAGFVAVLTLIPTAVKLWNHGGCGLICAVLLVASWSLPHPYGTLSAATALSTWSLRKLFESITHKLLVTLVFALGAAVLAWTSVSIWSICTIPLEQSATGISALQRLQQSNSLQLPALAIFCLCVLWMNSERFRYLGSVTTAALAALSIFVLPISFKQTSTIGTKAEMDSFADWRDTIPPSSSVLVLPSRYSAAFVWFSLQRPSYLTVNQSAGVVFSADTAAEIRRRSEVLLPVMEPNWKLMKEISRKLRGEKFQDPNRPLTIDRLFAICADPQLGFVIAKANLGAFSIRSRNSGEWKDWNLYDCSRIRDTVAQT